MLALSLGLAALAIALAWPVPILLSRARWTWRSPTLALVLWQAIALAGGFSMLSSLLVFGLQSYGDSLSDALGHFLIRVFDGSLWAGDFPPGFGFLHAASLCLAALLFTHLILNLAVTTTSTVRHHRRHRDLIELLSTPVPGQRHTRQVAVDTPFAYCLPGLTSDMTVVSEGLVRRLNVEELEAVIAHEQAHLEQRHTVVLTVFAAWASALPWFPIATRAEESVALLIEMLADDLALRSVSRDALVASIRVVALGQQAPVSSTPLRSTSPVSIPPTEDPFASVPDASPREHWIPRAIRFLWAAPPRTNPVEARVRRLLDDPNPLGTGARGAVITSAVLLLVLPPLAIF
ncbi:MAG: M56 family metallopeptidase [Gulosibacter sp.]|uniref:M56 family metallopeptidase n=1 Tax=Gulosibacter sp. TaxID=2817531 RepID=UPI003F91A473